MYYIVDSEIVKALIINERLWLQHLGSEPNWRGPTEDGSAGVVVDSRRSEYFRLGDQKKEPLRAGAV